MRRLALLIALLPLASALTAQVSTPRRVGAVVQTDLSAGSSPRGSRLAMIPLEGGRIRIDFDLLGYEEPVLAYRLRHCDRHWQPSDLAPIEYLSGLEGYDLEMPEPSRNTLQPYMHYRLELPNEQTAFRASGNYLIEIYATDDPERTLLVIPLAVSEGLLSPLLQQRAQTTAEVLGRAQQVEVVLPLSPGLSSSPERELTSIVLQNGRLSTSLTLDRPSELRHDALVYDGFRSAIFPAGNEYLKVEHLTDRGGGLGIERTRLARGLYEQVLYPTPNRAGESYLYEEDRNGREVIRALHTAYPEVDADYHWVQLTFVSPRLSGGSVVVEGQCVDFVPLEERTMQYNVLKSQYEICLPLKMGYHEYQYLFLPDGAERATTAPTMGDHYQTTNEYEVLVYLRRPQDRYDRLIGFARTP